MYLKSLVLKGFKSFADKSVLTIEPGITAIVGPNGSGKSNISDAVLWVLGERSAKNLRGQAMEDVIFAGSAARKAVSVAEVELVLDNSDGTIPVDYDEVSIARRMYRSGESEYLVNGAIVRRLDVLDILHDSGLGTGTHSIISQGSLDSILQSKPEDRRALIEEAAGVLKHKQRKEKSARKIAAMDHHLDRVRDITHEVERQLGPLERKAKRAQAYLEANEQLSELRLSLAVDDLRKLQERWESVCASEESVGNELASSRDAVEVAEKHVNDAQEAMRKENEDAGELARRQRRAATASERLDSSEKVMRERKRSAMEHHASIQSTIEANGERERAALIELDTASRQQSEVAAALEEAIREVELVESRLEGFESKRKALDDEAAEINAFLVENEKAQANAQREKAAIQEGLSSGRAHEKLVEARRHELAANLERAQNDHDVALKALETARSAFEKLEAEEAQAKADLVKLFDSREKARSAYDDAQGRAKVIETELKSLDRAAQLDRSGNKALEWVIENSSVLSGSIKPLVQTLKVPKPVEELVENLLGEDIASVAIEDDDDSSAVVSKLINQKLAGSVGIVPRSTKRSSANPIALECRVGTPLVKLFDNTGGTSAVAETLFGDVVVCDSSKEAFDAHANDTLGLRFVSRDGCVIWPNGKVRVFGASVSGDEGVLARERRRDELLELNEQSQSEIEKLALDRDAAEADYRSIQARSLQASQELANQKGILASAEADEKRAAERLSSCADELESIAKQVAEAHDNVEDLVPKMADVEALIDELATRRKEQITRRDTLMEEARPLQDAYRELTEQLAGARLERARLSEREAYSKRMVSTREDEIASIRKSNAESKASLFCKSIAVKRADSIISSLEQLAVSLQRRNDVLEEAIIASQNASSSVHESASKARQAAREAQNALNTVSERMTEIRVEKSRLEIQVDAAVRAVVTDCGVPLDKASELPELEDRRAVEDQTFKLERRIKNMGAISPDAADEYAALKERYDFLAGQLSDMESARKSLRRIMRAIDERMKDDFAKTFEQVNENFAEVFSILFPGGSASLVLDNPEDLENSGVEVTAQPRGKRLTKMMLMSGGEKSLTALALLFAVYKTRSTPFYILDEVEAALDDTNLRRLVSYIDTLRGHTQLIMITHQRRTMEMADVLFGVSMQADGVTKVISQKLERALENAE